jgi:thiol:disulfide interchange protein
MALPKRRKPAVASATTSGRYTPPKPKAAKHSALWVPAVMFTALGTGLVVLVGNYLELLPGGQAQNSYLLVGLGLLITGFAMSTQYR